jgi:hypothetical protein
MHDELMEFSQPSFSQFSFRPLLLTLLSLVFSWSPSFPLALNVPRIINCIVVTLSVSIAALFVFVPPIARAFPSGASACVTTIFIFSSSGFGSSLKVTSFLLPCFDLFHNQTKKASRERLTGGLLFSVQTVSFLSSSTRPQ